MLFIAWAAWLILAVWFCRLAHQPFHMLDESIGMKITQYATLLQFAAVVHFNPWSC